MYLTSYFCWIRYQGQGLVTRLNQKSHSNVNWRLVFDFYSQSPFTRNLTQITIADKFLIMVCHNHDWKLVILNLNVDWWLVFNQQVKLYFFALWQSPHTFGTIICDLQWKGWTARVQCTLSNLSFRQFYPNSRSRSIKSTDFKGPFFS